MTRGLASDTILYMPITIDNILDIQEAASALGVSYVTIYRWIKSGKIVPIRIAGRTLIPKSEIERLKSVNKKAA